MRKGFIIALNSKPQNITVEGQGRKLKADSLIYTALPPIRKFASWPNKYAVTMENGVFWLAGRFILSQLGYAT